MCKTLTYIWLLAVLALTAGCSFSEGDECTLTEEQQPMLSIYVYAPAQPLLTRADVGNTAATDAEARVHSLQLWVFEHATGNLVAYYSPASTDALNTGSGSDVYQVQVSDAFADGKPNVDVYVVANVTTANSGHAFDGTTTRGQLEAAMLLDTGIFGRATLRTDVPDDGIPMSGVLKNQPISGERPVLRIGADYSSMATVRLVRTVSKLRFVFSQATGSGLSITGITLNERMLPNEQYLFLEEPYTGRNSHVSGYAEGTTSLMPTPIATVSAVEDPTVFLFREGMESAQQYEDRINTAIADGQMSAVGAYYLLESDKQLTGTISYSVNGVAKPDKVFTMSEAGDFSRNHTWLVYAYYGASMLELNVVSTNGWIEHSEENHETHNW